MTKPIITVENLSKAYRIGLKEEIPDTFVGAMTSWAKAPLQNWRRIRKLNTFELPAEQSAAASIGEEADRAVGSAIPEQAENDIIWALRDVSFDVHEGEVVGIIGRNGAGKSTLLKILSRITEPTSGRAVIRGRVSSLLEVGTGFHPELTGRENIYMNGTILGMTKKEIDRKFDEIVEFSGVERFLDTPVKRYSSGMTVRLAFAVAAHLDPEVLIVDEVLAVGDAAYQEQCHHRIRALSKTGITILFVSHNLALIPQLCSRCLVLRNGGIANNGPASDMIDYYRESVSSRAHRQARLPITSDSPVFFSRVNIVDPAGHPRFYHTDTTDMIIDFCLVVAFPIPNINIAINITSLDGTKLCSAWNRESRRCLRFEPGRHRVRCVFSGVRFRAGHTLGIELWAEANGRVFHHVHNAVVFPVVPSDTNATTVASADQGYVQCNVTWEYVRHSGRPNFTTDDLTSI